MIVGLAYMAFTYFVPIKQQPSWLTQARSLPLIQSSAEVLLSLAPEHGLCGFRQQAAERRNPP